tara:strand:+ start:10915 stop:11148 length:234 start_codon:yes stop_codon:yes gene_type:complete
MSEETKTEKKFWHSKKWWAMLAGVLVPVINKVSGLELSTVEILTITGPLLTYILGQGVADLGKNSTGSSIERLILKK